MLWAHARMIQYSYYRGIACNKKCSEKIERDHGHSETAEILNLKPLKPLAHEMLKPQIPNAKP